MQWEDLTTEEFGAIDRATPVVLNIAAIEQHGPHLPLHTDATIGQHLLDRLDARLQDGVLILPQVKVACSDHHLDFPGTLSVRHETFLLYVGEILRSVVHHGFHNLVLFNSHGGNQAVGQVLIEKLGSEYRNCRFAMLTWWRLAAPGLAAIRESRPGGVGHACEFETSLMLHAAPDAVRETLVPAFCYAPTHDWAEGDMLIGERGSLFRTMAEKSNGTGIVGDPSLASAGKGARIAESVVAALIEVIESLRAATAPSPDTTAEHSETAARGTMLPSEH